MTQRRLVLIKEYTINQIRDDILKGIYLEQPDVSPAFPAISGIFLCQGAGAGS